MPDQDFQTTIKTTERGECIFVDKFDDEAVWLSIQVRGGGAHVTMTNEQAAQMLAALTAILTTKETS